MTEPTQNLNNSMGATLGVGTDQDPDGLGKMPPAAIPQVTTTPAPVAPGTQAPAPAASGTTQPAPGSPQSSSAPQNAPLSDHASIFSKVLKGLSGLRPGMPTQYIDPQGNPVASTRATLSNSILAGAIAGMFAKPQYRQGEFGPVYDSGGTASEAFNAGQKQTQEKQDQAQKWSDEEWVKKMATISNTVAMTHQYAALAATQHQELEQVAEKNKSMILADLHRYDENQPADSRLIQGTDLTWNEAMDKLKGNLTSQNSFIDGYRSTWDQETGREKVEPTFTVIKSDGKIAMSEEASKELAKFKPQYENAYKVTGGNLQMPIRNYLSDMHTYNSLTILEEVMKRADADLGINPDKVDFFKAARENAGVRDSFKEAENAIAQGGSAVDVLERIMKDPNGRPGPMLAAMGLTPDQASELVRTTRVKEEAERAAALERAKEGVLNPKAPASDAEKQAARDVISQLPKEQQAEFLVTLDNSDGIRSGDIKDLMKQARDQYNKNRELDPNGTGISTTQSYPNEWVDPKTNKHYNLADSLFNAVEGNEDPTQFSKRSKTYNGDLARANEYSFARYSKAWDPAQATIDYKFAQNIGTQNTLKYLNSLTGEHNEGGNLGRLIATSNSITRTDFPKLNDAAAWARLETGDPAIARYHTDVTEVADQVAKILQGGGSGGGTSDAKLKQAQELFQTGFSKDQMKGVADELLGLLANRKTEFIGNNRYLQKQFPQSSQSNQSQQSGDSKQQKLQAITMPGGGHPADIKYGANGVSIVWSGKAGDPWINLATGQPVR
jgi:hypothetical protein